MAVPIAFPEARDKLQWTRQQGDRAAQGVQRERNAPMDEVVRFHGKGHVRQQVTKSTQRVLKSEEREQEPQEFRQEPHVGLFRAPTANLDNFPGLDFLEGQDQGRNVLAQMFQTVGG